MANSRGGYSSSAGGNGGGGNYGGGYSSSGTPAPTGGVYHAGSGCPPVGGYYSSAPRAQQVSVATTHGTMWGGGCQPGYRPGYATTHVHQRGSQTVTYHDQPTPVCCIIM